MTAPVAPSMTPATTPPGTPSASATPTVSGTANQLRITSVSNFRDVSGTGLELADGKRMALGVVYRAAKLSTLSASDSRELTSAGVSEVIDLRTDEVAARSPDVPIKGADHQLVNMFAVYRTPSVTYRTAAAAVAHMEQMNVDFVTEPAQRHRIATALKLVAAADGPVVVHCTEGKDRTGWISALLQLNAGASRAQVMTEYVKSNQYRAATIDAGYRAKLKSSGRAAAEVELALSRVRPGYLGAGLDELDAKYGGISGYLTKGLGLSTTTITRLQARLTA
ncbi:MAG: tyrosine-protein phosphatase [Propionicimonas sp.]